MQQHRRARQTTWREWLICLGLSLVCWAIALSPTIWFMLVRE
jgi:hypothetical protein